MKPECSDFVPSTLYRDDIICDRHLARGSLARGSIRVKLYDIQYYIF